MKVKHVTLTIELEDGRRQSVCLTKEELNNSPFIVIAGKEHILPSLYRKMVTELWDSQPLGIGDLVNKISGSGYIKYKVEKLNKKTMDVTQVDGFGFVYKKEKISDYKKVKPDLRNI